MAQGLDKGKEREQREPGSTPRSSGTNPLDLLRIKQKEKTKATPLPSDFTIEPPEGRSSEAQIVSSNIGLSAEALLREINIQETRADMRATNEIRQRLTRITGESDFLKKNPEHTEVGKMRDAIRRKRQASQHGHLLDHYFAHRDLLAAQAEIKQEVKNIRLLENSLKGFKHVEDRLNDNEHALDNDTVKESINELTKELSGIQKEQKKVIAQWKRAIDNIERCVVELKQHVPDLPLPDLDQDKALTFPQGKTKEKDEPSDKAEKETKKSESPAAAFSKQGDQPSSSGDQAESVAKTTASKELELSEDAKKLYKEFEGHLRDAHILHRKLKNLNSQWDNFADKRKSQTDQLKAAQDLQSKHASDAMNAMAANSDKGKSDIAAAMKYVTRLLTLGAMAAGGVAGGIRMKL